jgi:cytochrome P450
MPGVFGNILSFIGGAHACIGYRFSLYECVPSCSSFPC